MTSSTSSSDSGPDSGTSTSSNATQRRRYVGWGLVGLLLLMVILEVKVFRNLDFYGLSPGFIGQMAVIEHSIQQVDMDELNIVILGDSQSIDGLRPEWIAEELGTDPRTIFNFSLSGGSAFDIAKLYEQYEDRLPNVKQVIVVVNEHQLNNAHAAEDIKFKYTANLRDRFAVMNKDNYGDLLLGWALKAYDMRTIWIPMMKKYRQGELRDDVPIYPGGLAPITWSPAKDKGKDNAVEVADRWFDSYELEGVRTQSFVSLIKQLRERGIDVTIMQLPRTDDFEDAVQEKYAAEQMAYFNKITTIAAQYGAEFSIIANDELTMDQFRDTNHLNPAGAEWMSRYVAQTYLRP